MAAPPWTVTADGIKLTSRGATARLKRVKVAGSGHALAAALEKICAMG